MPKVSVIMSVYNGRPYLRRSVDSVLNQEYEDFELIIVEDGSRDGSKRILKKYSNSNEKIRLIENEKNRGITVSKKKGISRASGEYLAMMDADDICFPHRLGVQVRYLDENPECVLVGGQVILIDDKGDPILSSDELPVDGSTGQMKGLREGHESIEKSLLEGEWPLVHPAVMMRSSAVKQVGGYDVRYPHLQDLDLFLKLSEIGRLKNLKDVLVKYRRHDEQTTRNVIDQNYLSRLIRRRAYNRREIDLRNDLKIYPIIKSRIGMFLRKTPLWNKILELYNKFSFGR